MLVVLLFGIIDVTLTGGHGAVGRFLVEELDARGHEVTVFDITDDEMLRSTFDHEYVDGDVTDADAVADAVAVVDAVVHLAALKRPACEARPKRAQEVIVGGTVNVFEAAVTSGARVVHVSTKSIFGQISGTYAYPSYDPLPEDAPKQPVGDIYGLTKMATESYRQAYVRKHDLDVASFRFASALAARMTDAWFVNPHATLTEIAGQKERYDEIRAEGGMDSAVPLFREAYVAETTEEAIRVAEAHLKPKYEHYIDWARTKPWRTRRTSIVPSTVSARTAFSSESLPR